MFIMVISTVQWHATVEMTFIPAVQNSEAVNFRAFETPLLPH